MTDISVILPVKLEQPDNWQIDLTEFAINTMRMHTKKKYELIIVESGTKHLKDYSDIHIIGHKDSGYTRDVNAGIEVASGKYIVHTANDIIVGPDWLEALVEPFEKVPGCGASTISIIGSSAVIGAKETSRAIIEGFSRSLMMVEAGWKLDEAFTGQHSDSDLIMRIYESGKRSYRNHRAIAYRLDGKMHKKNTTDKQQAEQLHEADMLFRARYESSPLWMAKMILRGTVNYGREHEG